MNSIKDYFGTYKDKIWEQHELIKEEIFLLKQQTPKLQEKVNVLEKLVAAEKRKKRVKTIFEKFEADKNVIIFLLTLQGTIGTKQIIEKLSGNKKFDVDEKFSPQDFPKILDVISDNDPNILDQLLSSLEEATKGNSVYKEDLENPLYKKVFGIFKELKKTGKK